MGLHISKGIVVIKKLASLQEARGSSLRGTETLPTSPTHSECSIKGPNSLQLAMKEASTMLVRIAN